MAQLTTFSAESDQKNISFKNMLQSWKVNIKKYFFSYEDGFFKIFILRNSPALMIENVIDMPMSSHDKSTQIVICKNPFLDAKIFYLKIIEELYVINSTCFYKKNVLDQFIYDELQSVEYFSLALKFSEKKNQLKDSLYNGTIYNSNSWLLFKPGTIKNVCHFKDTQEMYYTIFFTKKWLIDFLASANELTNQFMNLFIASDLDFVMWPRNEQTNNVNYNLFNQTLHIRTPVKDLDTSAYLELCKQMFEDFASNLPKTSIHADQFRMSNDQRIKVLKAENYLSQFYNKDFPGIEVLAEKVGLSTTGLKTGFNQIYGISVYKYFQKNKMKIAFEILKSQNETKIKDLALQMGYESNTKFSIAFKEVNGVLPSEVKENL